MCNLAISVFALVIYQITQILSLDLPRFGSGQTAAGRRGGERLSNIIAAECRKQTFLRENVYPCILSNPERM